MSVIKSTLKYILKKIPINFTKNQQYDAQTKKVIQIVCSRDSCCIDVGAHKGEVMDIILKYAPNGIHYAFEPIPVMYESLVVKYSGVKHCNVVGIALNNEKGVASFNYVVSNPSYSGLVKRKYDRPDEKDTTIEVETDLLDNVLPDDYKPTLIKIDVEGGELRVLEGAKSIIAKTKPVIIFEHGIGASDMYGATPEQVFTLLADCGLRISTMKRWLKNRPCFTKDEFSRCYSRQEDYYFIAYP